MSVIIRLQNLAWSANASDIREFFKGLSVPEGGVHIVGGEMGDAFIAFSTDEDARLGMMKSGEILKGVQVTLSLSSRTQMQKVIEAARQLVMPPSYAPAVQPLPIPAPPPQSLPVPPQQQPPLPFSQPNNSLPTSMGGNQPIVHPEVPKQVTSMYRAEPLPVPPFAQQPFPGQPSQYATMFPGSAMKPPLAAASADGFPTRPAMPMPTPAAVAPMQGQYYTVPDTPPADSVPPAEKKALPAANVESKQPPAADNDKRDRRADYNRGDRKDRESSRDDRRRRSKSRSRSRDRRRRYRSRSRDRSDRGDRGDRGSRYRRSSRSRDRDRSGKDRRDKDTTKRPSRDHRERNSQESADSKSSQAGKDGIPGLGEIPVEIAKDKIKMATPEPQNEPVLRTPHTRWGGDVAARSSDRDSRQPIDMEIEQVDMEIESDNQDQQQSPSVPASSSFVRQPAPAMRQQLPAPDRQSQRERSANPSAYVPPGAQNGQPAKLEPPTLAADGSMEGPKFLRNAPDDPRSNGGATERNFQSAVNAERRYDEAFVNMNNRNSSRPEESHSRGRGGWSQDSFQPLRPQRPENSWGNNEGPSVSRSDKFAGQSDNKSGQNEFWNNRGPDDDFSRESRWSDRPAQGRFSSVQDYYRGANNRSPFPRDGRGNGMDHRRGGGGGEFYDQRPSNYQEDMGGFRGRGSYRSRGGNMGNVGPDGMRERKPRTSSIEITNIPFNISYKAIRDLFYGIPIPPNTIKILPDKEGHRSALALMRFNNPADASEAFKRSPFYIGDSQIGVNFCDEIRYDNSIDVQQNGNPNRRTFPIDNPNAGNCIKINGLPEACTESDIAQIFSEFRIDMIVIERNPASGELTGTSMVLFGSMQDTEGALQKLQGVTLDGNYLKGEVCPETVMFKAIDAQRQHDLVELKSSAQKPSQEKPPQNSEQAPPPQTASSPAKQQEAGGRQGVDLLTDSVVIKNVPCEVGKSTITDFFTGDGIIPEKIYFGKPNHDKMCEIYVVFAQVDCAPKAVLKSGQMIGPVKADIELISKPTVMRVLGLPFDPLELFKKSNKADIVDISRAPLHRDADRPPARHEDRPIDRPPTNERRVPQEMNPRGREREPMNQPPRDHLPRDHPSRDHPSRDHPPRDRPFYPGRPNYPPESVNRPASNSVAPDRFGRPGCVVALGNVPYSATTEDILQFFHGFTNVSPDCVIRRYDEFNRPTADARVALVNSDEAIRATNTLHREYMMNRPIFINLVN